ncbi:hypothetical protein LTS02_017276 [Friedmanniomyces endolithicus]|nr:hypothetical protein LTS02_017276 [Friedmanniomyces endolithicus]
MIMMLVVPLLSIASSIASSAYIVPRPHGPFGVNFGVASFTDHSRLDPFASRPENRSIVVSAFYPVAPVEACAWRLVPAYPPATAAVFDAEVAFARVPNGELEKLKLEICTTHNASGRQHEVDPAPGVLFSGGIGLSRLWYSAIAQAVASHGYTVVTVDHPYDADVVEFPDRKLITAINCPV